MTRTTSSRDMEGGTSADVHYIHGKQTTQWSVTRETANGYQFLGMTPLLGRSITPEDTKPGAPPVFMMTYQLWKNQSNGDPSVLGKTFNLDGVFYTLVAVMPPRFRPGWTDIFTAFPMDRSEIARDRTLKNAFVWPLGYLKPGIAIPQAAANLDIVARRLAKVHPNEFPKQFHVTARSFFVMLSTFAGVGLLLVVIGVYSVMAYNVSLQTREIGIRMALGAQQSDVLRSVLRRGAVLISMGAAFGLFLAWAVTRLIQNQLWRVKPNDPLTLSAVTAIVLLVGLFACVGPARRATQVDPFIAIREE